MCTRLVPFEISRILNLLRKWLQNLQYVRIRSVMTIDDIDSVLVRLLSLFRFSTIEMLYLYRRQAQNRFWFLI